MTEAYQSCNAQHVADLGAGLTVLLGHMDSLLGSQRAFLLGPRLEQVGWSCMTH